MSHNMKPNAGTISRMLISQVFILQELVNSCQRYNAWQMSHRVRSNTLPALRDLIQYPFMRPNPISVCAHHTPNRQLLTSFLRHMVCKKEAEHEILFQFPEAFALNQHWLERHPDDLSALSDFTEKHFTTGRFTECAQRIGPLVENPTVEARTKIALRAIEIANLLALNNVAQVPDKLQTLIDSIAAQPDDFKITWTFNGTKHFIDHAAQLSPYRTWLGQLFTALEAEDRQTALMGLQAARAGLQAVAQ